MTTPFLTASSWAKLVAGQVSSASLKSQSTPTTDKVMDPSSSADSVNTLIESASDSCQEMMNASGSPAASPPQRVMMMTDSSCTVAASPSSQVPPSALQESSSSPSSSSSSSSSQQGEEKGVTTSPSITNKNDEEQLATTTTTTTTTTAPSTPPPVQNVWKERMKKQHQLPSTPTIPDTLPSPKPTQSPFQATSRTGNENKASKAPLSPNGAPSQMAWPELGKTVSNSSSTPNILMSPSTGLGQHTSYSSGIKSPGSTYSESAVSETGSKKSWSKLDVPIHYASGSSPSPSASAATLGQSSGAGQNRRSKKGSSHHHSHQLQGGANGTNTHPSPSSDAKSSVTTSSTAKKRDNVTLSSSNAHVTSGHHKAHPSSVASGHPTPRRRAESNVSNASTATDAMIPVEVEHSSTQTNSNWSSPKYRNQTSSSSSTYHYSAIGGAFPQNNAHYRNYRSVGNSTSISRPYTNSSHSNRLNPTNGSHHYGRQSHHQGANVSFYSLGSSSSSSGIQSTHGNNLSYSMGQMNLDVMPQSSSYVNMSGYQSPIDHLAAELETIKWWISSQIEYYFSTDNLCKDLYFRSKMNALHGGSVPLSFILSFNRVRFLLAMAKVKVFQDADPMDAQAWEVEFAAECLKGSSLIEVVSMPSAEGEVVIAAVSETTSGQDDVSGEASAPITPPPSTSANLAVRLLHNAEMWLLPPTVVPSPIPVTLSTPDSAE